VAAELRAFLADTFPECFKPKRVPKLPLKIGIRRDIALLCPELAWNHLQWALADYTSGPRYWSALVEGATRVDLFGEPAGTVSAEHAAIGRQRLAEIAARTA
jgi:ProP effector